MNKVVINQGRVFPGWLIVSVMITILLIITLAFSYLPEDTAITLAIIATFLFPLVWSCYQVMIINIDTQTISNFIWLASFKINRKTDSYDHIDEITIDSLKMSKDNLTFKALLKTSEGKEYFLHSAHSKADLEAKLRPIREKLLLTK